MLTPTRRHDSGLWFHHLTVCSRASGACSKAEESEILRLRGDIRRLHRAAAAGAPSVPPAADTTATTDSLEAEIAAAGSDRSLLHDLISSQAGQLLRLIVSRHRPCTSSTAPRTDTASSQASARHSSRAQSARVGSLSSGVKSDTSGSAGSSPTKGEAHSAAGGSSEGFETESFVSVLLESAALLSDLHRQTSSHETAHREAEARADQMQAKFETAKQETTMLRNMIGELQSSGKLDKAGGSIRPSTAGESLKLCMYCLHYYQAE